MPHILKTVGVALALVTLGASCADTPDRAADSEAASPTAPATSENLGVTSAPTGRIAFASDRQGHSNVFTMNPDGSGVVQITNSNQDGQPNLSWDGSFIVFVSTRDGNEEIYVMKADGTDQTRLTNTPASEGRPRWSPDGSRISFLSDRDGNWEIYVMNADGPDRPT